MTVILDTNEYNNRVFLMLSTFPYRKLMQDPTPHLLHMKRREPEMYPVNKTQTIKIGRMR